MISDSLNLSATCEYAIVRQSASTFFPWDYTIPTELGMLSYIPEENSLLFSLKTCGLLFMTNQPGNRMNYAPLSTESHIIMKDRTYSAKIQTVNNALDLLKSRPASQAAKKYRKIASSIDDRTAFHCCSSKLHNSYRRKRKKVTSSGFSRTLIAIEMRKCLMKHDWSHLAELLPLLLEGRLETEPLVWRYLLSELLYSPKGTLATLNHFIEMCVGSQCSVFLKKVLTLPLQAEDPDST